MQKKLLTELLQDLKQKMVQLGYSKVSMQFYDRHWKKLLQFAEERRESFYSEQLGLDFVEQHYRILEKEFSQKLSRREADKLRIIRMIGDFQLHGVIFRRRSSYNHKDILSNPYFIDIHRRFHSYCKDKGYSQSTIGYFVRLSARFMGYLSCQNIADCQAIDQSLIHAYIKTLAGYNYHTVQQNIFSMRAFFRFLLDIGEIQTDLAAMTPMVQARKRTRIPSVWTKDELQKLIAAIDRGSPQGRRDYAIILLACCLGLRISDIKNLKRENFYWEEKKLVFTQSKTKEPLSLPLTLEVGWAVIDYLQYGRPKIESPFIFVKHVAPFGPFAEDVHLYYVIRRYMELAHIPMGNKKRGMHSLRHTLASQLLEQDTPIAIISEILGHVDTNSTAVYLKVGIQKLKDCSLTFEEVTDHE
jgi:site-specific recombinase XerD